MTTQNKTRRRKITQRADGLGRVGVATDVFGRP